MIKTIEEEMIIKTKEDFFKFLNKYSKKEEGNNKPDFIFRGVKSEEYDLIPSIGRIKKGEKELSDDDEKLMLKVFKHRTYPFTKEFHGDELELLTIAQHHGLPTRLLDWTKNILTATYFAVEEDLGDDNETKSCIYIYHPIHKAKLDSTFNPFCISHVKRYFPKHWDKRIVNQEGLFTVHPNPYTPWENDNITRVLIDNGIRKEIKRTLNKLGVNSSTIYPDLDGISKHIKWLRSDEH